MSEVKITYDPEVDAMYIQWSDQPVANTREMPDGTVVDYDAQGQPVGVELLNVQTLKSTFPQPAASEDQTD